MKYCKNCGTKLKDNEIICETCGTRQPKSQMKKKNTGGLSRTETIIIIIGACLVIGIIISIVLLKTSKNSSIMETNMIAETEEYSESELNEENIEDNVDTETQDSQIEESGIKIELDESSETLMISGTGTLTKDKMTEGFDFSKQVAIKKVLIGDDIVIENGESSKDMFDRFDSLEYVELPNTMTSLEDGFFDGCQSLVSVKMPESLTSIGENAFHWCGALESIDIPETVIEIGTSAFDGCRSLSSVSIPNGVKAIPVRAFNGCTALQEVSLGDETQSIAQEAFSGCEQLRSITLPDSVEDIGDKAFASCSALTGVQLPANLKKIGSEAFSMSQNAFTELIIPEGVEEIGGGCFSYCKITDVTFKTETVQIGAFPFFSCGSIKSLTLPEALSSLEKSILESSFSQPLPEVIYY